MTWPYDYWSSFIYFGPWGGAIWILGGSIILAVIASVVNTRKLKSALDKNTVQLQRIASALEEIVCELKLNTSDIKTELGKNRASIESLDANTISFHQTMRRMMWWSGGDTKK